MKEFILCVIELLLPCCKVYFNFCFQSTRVFCSWSVGHSEKSVTTTSYKTEETRFQGSTSRVETPCQVMRDSGYVRSPISHSQSPIPQSPNPPSHVPQSPIPYPPIPLLSLESRLGRVQKRLWQSNAWVDANRHDHVTQTAQILRSTTSQRQNQRNIFVRCTLYFGKVLNVSFN